MVYIGHLAAALGDELADLLRDIRYPLIFDIGMDDEGKLIIPHIGDDPPPFFRKALPIHHPGLTTGITIAQSGDFGKRLDAESEMDDITILHDVFLALQMQKPPLSDCGERAASH
jgi:hypothetical protein